MIIKSASRLFLPFVLVGYALAQSAGGLGGATIGIRYQPVAYPQIVQSANLSPVAITLVGFDGQGNTLTYAIVTQPSHGSLSGFDPVLGTATYTPTDKFAGLDSFTFQVTDGVAVSQAATVSISLNPLVSLVLSPSVVHGGLYTIGTLSLLTAVSGSAVFAHLASSNPSAVRIPSTVVIQPGRISVKFMATTLRVKPDTIVTLTASGNASSATSVLTIR